MSFVEHASWGTNVVRREADGIPFLVFESRPRSLRELFDSGVRWADRDHVVGGDRRLSFAEVRDGARSTAAGLVARGLTPGDNVLLLGFNSPDWLLAFWGIVEAGAVVVLGNAWWSPTEVAHAVELTAPTIVIADAVLVPKLPAHVTVVEMASIAVGSQPLTASSPHRHHEDDPAVIIFTSGSTGLPKGVVLSHRACIAMQHALFHRTNRLPHDLADDFPRDVNLQTGPLFHIGGVQGLMRAWLLGATMVLTVGRFEPGEILRLIESERICRWGAVPTMVSRLLACPEFDDFDVSSMRSLTVGGSTVPAAMFQQIREHFPNAQRGVTQIYGLSEAGGTLAMASSQELTDHPGTVGRPLEVVELRIDLPDDIGVGEIVARSPGQMTGYWGDTDDTTISPDGWLRTGDLGRIDDDGYLHLTGRVKDVIIRGGENIAAAHVEQELLTHQAIEEIAVVGLADPDLGEVVGAVVALRPGALVTTEELAAHARARLAYFEVPTRWWVHEGRLPVTASGKFDKPLLRRSFPITLSVHARSSREGSPS